MLRAVADPEPTPAAATEATAGGSSAAAADAALGRACLARRPIHGPGDYGIPLP
ncbi:MAG: hypothetical protein RLZZ468_1493, partial [Cyanobacteriota bacterium]